MASGRSRSAKITISQESGCCSTVLPRPVAFGPGVRGQFHPQPSAASRFAVAAAAARQALLVLVYLRRNETFVGLA